ncbi:MAG: transposase, partial [Chthoniobacteraceae bacterium]
MGNENTGTSETSKFGRRHGREFKAKAVALVFGGRSQGEVSRDLGVPAWSLGEWIRKARAGHGPTQAATLDAESEEQRELRRLRQENDYLREQRDILKNALASARFSDRGVQYAAAAFARLAAASSITLSMSRTANPYDSALAERLPGTAVPALRAACGRLSRSARLVATLKAECFADSLPPTRVADTAPSASAPIATSKPRCSPTTKNTPNPCPRFRRKIKRRLMPGLVRARHITTRPHATRSACT